MRDPIHTDQEIITAGLALKAANVEVNGWSLRKQLDGKGKPARLAGIWKKWVDAEVQVVIPTLPDDLKSGLTSILSSMGQQVEVLLAGFYQEASDAAVIRSQETESLLAEATLRFERESAVACSELERLEAIIQERDEQLANANDRLGQLTQQLSAMTTDLNLATERLQVAENNLHRATAETAVVNTRCDGLQRQVQELDRKLAGEVQRADSFESYSKRLDSDLTKARSEASEASSREGMLAGQLGALKQQVAAEAVVTSNLRLELQRSSEAVTEKNVLLQVSQENEVQLRSELSSANEAIAAYKAELIELGRGKS